MTITVFARLSFVVYCGKGLWLYYLYFYFFMPVTFCMLHTFTWRKSIFLVTRLSPYINQNCQLSRCMGKPTICMGENKVADQLRGNRETDQRPCFRYTDSSVSLLLKSETSRLYLFSVTVQVGLGRTWSETTLLVFPRGGSIKINTSHVKWC